MTNDSKTERKYVRSWGRFPGKGAGKRAAAKFNRRKAKLALKGIH
jgi:hypothetical protein